jgi:putative transposase
MTVKPPAKNQTPRKIVSGSIIQSMHFQSSIPFHVYNRGNEKQTIFFNRDNYLFFLKKVRKEWTPYCKILAYCLMPNHFHFILFPTEEGCRYVTIQGKETHMQALSKAIGKTLSSYSQAVNLQLERTGNLFQHKTKAKELITGKLVNSQQPMDYLSNCLLYIHNNAFAANLVVNPYEWEFCSLPDYAGLRNGTLCDKMLTYQLSGMMKRDFAIGSGPTGQLS